MYLPGKIIRAGGNDPAVANTSIIDTNLPNPAWQQVQSMSFPRRRLNIVLLADGSVMAVGGTRASDDVNQAILEGEIWDPETKQWTVVASMVEARMYHSTALLLPDGRVVAAGGEASGRLHAQIYSPPYLFKGTRPVINSAPSAVSYGGEIAISTDAADITSVALLRPSAVTHAINMNQLYVPLSFTQGAGQVVATAPTGANLTPPGFYLLVIKNSTGVPSVATWIQLAADVSAGSVTGSVTDSGVGISGASVAYNGTSVVTGLDGVYTFASVPAGTHDFTASSSGFGAVTKTVNVAPGGLATLDFQLSAPGNIQGTVRDAVTSAGIAGATVGYVGGTVTTDANGAYTISGIAAGNQTITAVISGYQSLQASVDLLPGNTFTQNFALSKTRTEIDGNVSDAVTSLAIAGATASYSGGTTTSNVLGQYMFMNVVPGTYTVTVTAPGYVSQTHGVSVVTGIISTSDFTLIPAVGTGPVLTLTPVADAAVTSSKPTANYGTQSTLQLRQGTTSNPVTYHSYLQFRVDGLVGPVTSAKLRLFVTDGSPDGGSVFDAPNTWTEAGINWSNAPQPTSSTPLAGAGVATKGKWVEISLPQGEFSRSNGIYSFELTNNSSDSALFSSREAATGKPELVLAQGGSTLPSLTADFRADKQSGTVPLTVTFDSTLSAGNPSSWSWDFNNDNVVDSTQQNPSFTYSNAGQFTVKLTIGDGANTSVVTKVNYVNASLVSAPGVSATLLADAAVTPSKPTTNYGTQSTLQLRQGTTSNPLTYHSYLQFSLAGLTSPVASAKLRLFVTDSSPDGGSVFDVSSAWTETGINWSNAPQPTSSTALASAGLATKGKWLEISLPASEFSRGNGTYSFELITKSSDSAIYSSKQSTSPSQLVVTQGP